MATIRPQVTIGSGILGLYPAILETQLIAAQLSGDAFELAGAPSSLTVDLSRVEWFELGAVVQLVCLLQRLLRSGTRIELHPPTTDGSLGTDERRQARSFLRHIGFFAALESEAILQYGRVEIVEQALPGAPPPKRRSEVHHNEDLYKYVFPLTWFPNDYDADRLASFLAFVARDKGRGIRPIDAETLANVFLFELVDNVRRHSGQPNALIGAWARPRWARLTPAHYLKSERPFLRWIGRSPTPMIELVVADSGVGIARRLTGNYLDAAGSGIRVPQISAREEANVLAWSLDRYSTSGDPEKRGTRGLYRVDRIVRKYQGLISIRSGQESIAADHGGVQHDQLVPERGALPSVPGTVVRVRIPALRYRSPLPRARSAPTPVLEFSVFPIPQLGPDGLDLDTEQRLQKALRASERACVVCTYQGQPPVPHGALDALLRQLCQLRHPGMVVLWGLPGGWDVVENAIDAVNQDVSRRGSRIESASAEHFDIVDPVLVCGSEGDAGWVGVTPDEQTVLQALFNAESGTLSFPQLLQIIPEVDRLHTVLRDLRIQRDSVALHDDLSATILTNISGLSEGIGRYLETAATAPTADRSTYRTPSLRLVSRWIDTERLLHDTVGAELAMWVLSERLRDRVYRSRTAPIDYVVYDTTTSRRAAAAITRFLAPAQPLSIPGETGTPLPHGLRSVPGLSRVVFYADIVSSSETILRCLKQVIRDGGIPVAVLCLIDARVERNDSIDLWGYQIPFVAVTSLDLEPTSRARVININPVTRSPEPGIQGPEPSYPIPQSTLEAMLASNDSLHLSHVGNPIGRHFTLYANTTSAMSHPAVREAFDSEISSWIGHSARFTPSSDPDRITLWYPAEEPLANAPVASLAQWLSDHRRDVVETIPVRRLAAYGDWVFPDEPPEVLRRAGCAVILDSGSIGGTTAMRLADLAASAGAESVLVCVFLSHLAEHPERLLRNLTTITSWVAQESPVQRALPGFEASHRSLRQAALRVRFISRFDLSAYTQWQCPVCQQLERLAQERPPTALLEAFVRHQRSRLRERNRIDDVQSSRTSDFDGRDLPPELAIWMLAFRRLLSAALVSTADRVRVDECLTKVRERAERPDISSDVAAQALIRLLAVESHWLQKPPLYLRDLREKAAYIALALYKDPSSADFERRDALIVLRTASKLVFLTHIVDLFAGANASPIVTAQLCYGVFTFLDRPYHQDTSAFAKLAFDLQSIESGISGEEDLRSTLRTLAYAAEIHVDDSLFPDTASGAWAALRESIAELYADRHHPIITAFSRMEPGPDAETILARQMDPQVRNALARLSRDWEYPHTFLVHRVCPLLNRCRDVFMGPDAALSLGAATASRLAHWATSAIPNDLVEFSELVSHISADPETAFDPNTWGHFRTYYQWLWDTIFRGGGLAGFPSPELLRFLSTAPVDLGKIVADFAPSADVDLRGASALLGLSVFCPDILLRDLGQELVKNALRYRTQEKPCLAFAVLETSDGLTLAVQHAHTTPTGGGVVKRGHGLDKLRDRLTAFGNDMEWHVPDRDNSFEVNVHFLWGE